MNATPAVSTKRISNVVLCALLALAALAPYLHALDAPFIYDDEANVQKNPYAQDLSLALAHFGELDASTADRGLRANFRPLIPLSYSAAAACCGTGPTCYRLLNLILHALCVLLVFALLLKLGETNGRWPSFIAALLFALHPANVEAVVWISSLDDLLVTALTLGALLALLAGLERHGSKRGALIGLSLICAIAAQLSKENAAVLPALVGMTVLLRARRFDPRGLINALGWAALFALVPLAFFAWRQSLVHELAHRDYWGGGLWTNLLTVIKILAIYLRLAVLPVGLRVLWFFEPVRAADALLIARLALLPLPLALGLALRKRRPLVLYGALWFYVMLAPMSNIVPINALVAERFLYPALPGLIAAVVFSLAELVPAVGRRWLIAAWALVLLAFGAGTIARVQVWRDPQSFYADAVAKETDTPLLRNNYAIALDHDGLTAQAEEQFKLLLELAPDDADGCRNYAVFMDKHERRVEALHQLDVCLSRHPHDVEAMVLYAEVLHRLGDDARALEAINSLLAQFDCTNKPTRCARLEGFKKQIEEP